MPVLVDGTRGTVYILCSLGIWNISTFLSSVAGTATRIELVAPLCAVACSFIVPCFCSGLHAGLSRHMEKAQKFRVFTARECSSHGWGRCVDTPSVGGMIEKRSSSEARSCQTLRELSRPCLYLAIAIYQSPQARDFSTQPKIDCCDVLNLAQRRRSNRDVSD